MPTTSSEDDTILENIASADTVESVFSQFLPPLPLIFSLRSDWDNLRDVIKAKIQKVS